MCSANLYSGLREIVMSNNAFDRSASPVWKADRQSSKSGPERILGRQSSVSCRSRVASCRMLDCLIVGVGQQRFMADSLQRVPDAPLITLFRIGLKES